MNKAETSHLVLIAKKVKKLPIQENDKMELINLLGALSDKQLADITFMHNKIDALKDERDSLSITCKYLEFAEEATIREKDVEIDELMKFINKFKGPGFDPENFEG